MFEKRSAAVAPKAFTANGTDRGVVTVSDTRFFHVKQQVIIIASTLPNLNLEIKKVLSPTQLVVGDPKNSDINSFTDISAYTTALTSFIYANEQKRPSIPFEEFMRAMYAEEPAVAMRTFTVDRYGRGIDSVVDNYGITRLAVDGQFHAEVDVQVDVDIEGVYDPVDNPDPDNIGVIGVTRTVNPDETNQVQRISAKQGTEDTDTHSMDVSIHDHEGNAYRRINPLPVTGSFEKFFNLIGASKWMELAVYDEVVPSFSLDGLTMTLAYKEDAALLGEAVVYFNTDLDWNIKLNRYITEDDGNPLQDDDDSNLNLD